MSLTWSVIRILSEHDHLDVIKVAMIESLENLAAGRINPVGRVFRFDELDQVFEIAFLEFTRKAIFPALMDLNIHLFDVESFRLKCW